MNKLNLHPRLIEAGLLFDEGDLELLLPYRWHLQGKGYASAHVYKHGKRTKIQMHRLIMNAPNGSQVDHINRDKLDNRRLNLRLATGHQQEVNKGLQVNNKSGVRGVWWHKARREFRARIMVNREDIFLGRYRTIEEAVAARQAAEMKYYGELCPQ